MEHENAPSKVYSIQFLGEHFSLSANISTQEMEAIESIVHEYIQSATQGKLTGDKLQIMTTVAMNLATTLYNIKRDNTNQKETEHKVKNAIESINHKLNHYIASEGLDKKDR